MRLDGKLAIITAAASGMGRAGVELFLREGATVCAVDLNGEALDRLKADLDPDGRRLHTVQADLSTAEGQRQSIHDAAERLGGVDILWAHAGIPGPGGLPLFKPPYTHVTAIDLNTGDTLWKIPIGDGPVDHELLEGLDNVPKQLGDAGRPFVLSTKTLLFVALGLQSKVLYAYDKASGDELFRMELPAAPNGSPMTYSVDGKQFITIPVGGRRETAGLVSYALP